MSCPKLLASVLHCGKCCALALLSGCAASFDYQEIDVGPVAFEDAWVAVVEVAETDGYPLDPANTDRGRRVFESRWRTQALPFRLSATHRGVRRRVHAEFVQSETKSWLVRYYVERQVIGDMSGAFEPQEKHWESSGQDVDTELRIRAKLTVRFRPERSSSPVP